MKNSLNGFVCTCALVLACSLPGWTQAQKPDPQPAGQAASPQQTPPAQQTPPQQQPPQQQTPPAESDLQPIQRGRIPEPPPPPPKVPDVRRPGESGYFIGISGWFPTQNPTFNRGNSATFLGSSLITMQGKPNVAEGAEVGVAAGLHNSLHFSFFDTSAAGDYTTPNDVVAWSQTYTAGTYVATNYRIRNFKLSYEYLTWPYPVGSRKFRLKTLWQVQYTGVQTTFDAPKNYYDSNGNILLDASGNPISLIGAGTTYFVLPTFGLGAYYYPSRHFRFEANASGFTIPHHSTIWDTDASLNMRVAGHIEIRLGAKAFHFKTSTQAEYFVKGTMASAFFGLRWYSNSE